MPDFEGKLPGPEGMEPEPDGTTPEFKGTKTEFGLNEEQRPAVERHDRHLLLSAGAGSGKTRVLVERYLRILEDGDWDLALPTRILAITFTEKAALEMRERIVRALEKRAASEDSSASAARLLELLREMESAAISTIHGFCSRLLRENATEAGLDPRFRVPDELDLHELRRAALDELFAEEDPDLLLLAAALGVAKLEEALTTYRELRRSLGLSPDELRGEGASDMAARQEALARERLGEELLAWRGGLPARFVGLCAHLGGTHPVAGSQAKIDAAMARLAAGDPGSVDPGLPSGLLADMNRFTAQGKSVQDDGELKAAWEALKAEIKTAEETAAALHSGDGPADCPQVGPHDSATGPPPGLRAAFLRLSGFYAERIEREMRARSWLDFEDLQLQAVDLLSSSEAVRGRCREQFAHVMVDEFQDSNHLQLRLVRLLVPRDCPASECTLFLVGDPRQSIYAFRNAAVELFERERERMAAAGAAATLRLNYRSHPALLDFLNDFFPDDVFPSLEPGRRDEDRGTPRVLLQITPQDPGELSRKEARLVAARALAATLREARDSGLRISADGGRPLDWGDMAILLRSGTDIGIIARALAEQGIPHEAAGGRDFFLRQELRDLEDLIAALEDPHRRLKLARALRGDIIGLSSVDLIALLPTPPPRRKGRGAGVAKGSGSAGLAAAAASRAANEDESFFDLLPTTLSEDGRRRFGRFVDLYRRFHGRLLRLPLRGLILELIEASGYDLRAAAEPRALKLLRNLRQLADLVGELEETRRLAVREFLDLMARVRDVAPRREEAWVPEEGESLLCIQTIHSAKGLEFPLLVVADLDRDTSRNEAVDDIAGLRLDDEGDGSQALLGICWRGAGDLRRRDPVHLLIEREKRLRDAAENRRLLYVALTRAEDYLILSAVNPGRNLAETEAEFGPGAADAEMPGDGEPEFAGGGRTRTPASSAGGAPVANPMPKSFLDQVRAALNGPAGARCALQIPGRDEDGLAALGGKRLGTMVSIPGNLGQDLAAAAANWSRLTTVMPGPSLLEIPVTSLALLQNCPLRWLLERRFGLGRLLHTEGDVWIPESDDERGPTGGADFGTLLHGIMERWDFAAPAAEAFAAACPGDINADQRREAESLLLPLFMSGQPWIERLRRGRAFRREEAFALCLPEADGLVLTGQVDLVFEDGGQRFLLDWKSDRLETKEQVQSRVVQHSYQVAIYALALERAGLPVNQALLCFLRLETPFRQVDVDPRDLTWAANRIKHLGGLAMELTRLELSRDLDFLDQVPPPSRPLPCQSCPFKTEFCPLNYRSCRSAI